MIRAPPEGARRLGDLGEGGNIEALKRYFEHFSFSFFCF